MVFAAAALPTFLIFAASRTVLNPHFYAKNTLDISYDFLVEMTAERMLSGSDFLTAKFNREDLIAEIKKVFSDNIYGAMLNDIKDQLQQVQLGQSQEIIFSLMPYRRALITVSNTLAYKIYQELPTCLGSEPKISQNGLPLCIPAGASYDEVAKPILAEFELAIYNAVPEDLKGLQNVIPVQLLSKLDLIQFGLLIILALILFLITLVVYKPISRLFAFLGSAFVLGGALGVVLAMYFTSIFGSIFGAEFLLQYGAKAWDFTLDILSFTGLEVQRLAIVFLVVGVALLVLAIVLRNFFDQQKA